MQKDRHLPVLDGLRGIAILLVVFHHYGLSPDSPIPSLTVFSQLAWVIGRFGWAGVELFFVLSGFLLFLPYARALLQPGIPWPSARDFYRRRAVRILPAYFACLALIGTPLALSGGVPLQGLLLTPLLLHTFDTTAWDFVVAFNGPLWTLAIEWQFYLVLPALALGMRWAATWARRHTAPHAERRVIWLSLAVLVLTGFAIRAFAAWLHYGGGIAAPLNTPGAVGLVVRLLYGVKGRYLDSFAVGMALAVAYGLWIEPARWSRTTCRRLSLAAGLSGYLILAASCLWVEIAGRFVTADGWVWPMARGGLTAVSWALGGEWVVTGGFGLITLAALTNAGVLRRLLTWRPLAFIGLISYSLYLWHTWVLIHLPHTLPVQLCAWLAVAASSYYVIERPFLRWRSRSLPRRTPNEDLVPVPTPRT